MEVELLKYTKGGSELIAHSARVSGVPADIPDEEIIRMLVDNDYSSTLEHIIFTFDLKGISVALSRELLEHRIASHTARSTRYVEEKDFEYYQPPEFEKDPIKGERFRAIMKDINRAYKELRDMGATRESTRYVLPMATHCNYIWTVNARSLMNFLALRLCTRAAPEIKDMARKVHKLVIDVYPEIFKGIGCRGINWSVCPENAVRDSPQGKGCPYKIRGAKGFIPTKDDVRAAKFE